LFTASLLNLLPRWAGGFFQWGVPVRNHIELGSQTLPYEVIRTARKKTVGIEVRPQRGVIVCAPRRLSDRQIRAILHKKAKWISARLEVLEQKGGELPFPYLDSRKHLLLLGQRLPLEIRSHTAMKPRVEKAGGTLQVGWPENMAVEDKDKGIRALLVDYYRGLAREILWERICIFRQVEDLRSPFQDRK
jgi:predicted metal-dependent hydrolase